MKSGREIWMERRNHSYRFVCVMLILLLCLSGCKVPVSSDKTTQDQNTPEYTTQAGPIFGEESKENVDTTSSETDEVTTEEPTEESTEESTEDPFTSVNDTVYSLVSLNVRSEPSTDGEIIGALKVGEAVTRTGIGGEWMRVDYYGHVAYVYGEFVSETKPTEPETQVPPTAVEGTGILYDNGGYLVAIDPGHQGKGNSDKEPVGPGATELKAKVSSGTQGVVTGIPEHELNLVVSLYLRDELLARGYSVLMIRETKDVNISNAERAQMANEYKADAFVRVHANSHSNTSAKGALTMCMTPHNPYNGNLYKPSRTLSQLVLQGICDATGAAKKEIIETDSMTGLNWCEIPVTIVEMGFMSNAQEDQELAKDSYRRAMAKGIADGLDKYFGR